MKRLLYLLLGVISLSPIALQGQSVTTILSSGLFEPYGVAVDTNNNYYITDSSNNRILQFVPESNATTNFAGAIGVHGYVDGPGYLARFSNPQGIIAARGGFVVADSGNQRIRFVAMDGTVSTLAGGATAGTNDGAGVLAQFNTPVGLAVDALGNIYIADQVNNSIRMLDPANNVTTVASGFNRPSAVALDDAGLIYVADSGNHSIRTINPTTHSVALLAGSGSSQVGGLLDSLVATEALFDNPRGLLWAGSDTGLLVSDTDNHVLRRVFFNTLIGTNSVETIPSTVDSVLRGPVGLAKDINGNTLIVDLTGNALRSLVTSQPQPPVSDPQIGTVAMVTDQFNNTTALLTPVQTSVFNNDVVVGIQGESGTATYYTRDGTDPSPFNGSTPPPYQNGQSRLPTSIIDTSLANSPPSITIRAVSTAAARKASAIVSAVFNFQVGNPAIIGNNPGSVTMEDITANSQIYYTTDGSDPGTNSTAYTLGTKLNLVNGTNDVTLKARAFRNGYAPSRVVSQLFTYNNLQTSTVGISHDYIAGIGSTIVIPVEVQLRPNDALQSLIFRAEVTPNGAAVPISNQMRVVPLGAQARPQVDDFFPVPAPSTNMPTWRVYSQGAATGVAVGYLGTNAAFSVVGNAVVAMLAVPIPPTASVGDTYNIGVLFASGTEDAFETPLLLTLLPDRTITVANQSYIVGDTALSHWYNAGDFGNANINNNDVNDIFYASLGIRVPYTFSDLYNAMDTYPEDTVGTPGGDGAIRLLDWQTAFDRALRLNLGNWQRSWAPGGVRTTTPATLTSAPELPDDTVTATEPNDVVWQREAMLSAGNVGNVTPGSAVSVPISLEVQPDKDVTGLLFLAQIVPSPGAPAITAPVTFTPAGGISEASASASINAGIGNGWLVGTLPPLVNRSLLGSLNFTVPAGALTGAAYTVRLSHVDGSTLLDTGAYANYNLQSRSATVSINTPASTTPTIISDEWKLAFFGSLTNPLADEFADPDGDGVLNWQEFRAGTNPVKLRFNNLESNWRSSASTFTLRWFGAAGKNYVVETSTTASAGVWTQVAGSLAGQGNLLTVEAPRSSQATTFYRLREVQ